MRLRSVHQCYPRPSSSSYYSAHPPLFVLFPSVCAALATCQAGEKHLSPRFKKKPRATEVTPSFLSFRFACSGAHYHLFSNPSARISSKVTFYVHICSSLSNLLVEVQIMRGINHPSIVKLLSFSESPEYYFLVLECVSPVYSATIAIC